MNITIKTIPHDQHRYPTVGDWQFDDDGNLAVQVSEMGNTDYEFLVALHELVEAWLCRKRGVSTSDVDAFDRQFEKEREQGRHSAEDEPGDDVSAPYRAEHFFATNIERLTAAELCVDWKHYEETIYELP